MPVYGDETVHGPTVHGPSVGRARSGGKDQGYSYEDS